MTSPRLQSLAARYRDLTALIDREPMEALAGGGARLSLRAAGLHNARTDVAHQIAAEAVRALAAPAPESTTRPPCCPVCGAELAAADGGICARCGGGR